ncbi:MAG: UDP-N-acetyl-D-mannosamine dehydrogenase [Rhizobiaceae bacterium]
MDITVVGGGGHVGLPLSIAFANAGQKVLILDKNEAGLAEIAKGHMPFMEEGGEEALAEALASGNLEMATDPSDKISTGAVIVTIGTPVDEFLNPVNRVVKECIDELLPFLKDGQLLILRSTVFPGTSDWLDRYIKSLGRDIRVAFCLERVVQGKCLEEIKYLPQIVAGSSQDAEDAAAEIFGKLTDQIFRCAPAEAEFAKLFSNAYRYIEFAAANQFYMLAERAGVNFNNVYNAMTQSYPRAQHLPRPGFAAGPCLFKDTMQLAAYASNEFGLGHHAMLVNEGLVLFLIEKMQEKYDLASSTVGLLGMAFKANNDDTRSSLSYKMKKMLSLHAKEVLTTDPHVTTDPALLPLDEVIEESDLLVLCVPHSAYKDLDLRGKPVVDVWSYFDTNTANR